MKKIRLSALSIINTGSILMPFFSGDFMSKNMFDSPTSKVMTL